ncbi:E3 ubiquitin-protein ligase mgrn1 [Dispira simplex]|nr:E3 ubiquitin-protein ligase mgrn1 [Dispira simplex]
MEAGNHRYVDLSFDFGEFNQLWWQDLIKADNVPRKSCVMPHATTKIPRHKTEARISTVSTDHNYRDIHLQHDHTTSETVYSPTNASCSTPAVQPIPLSSGGQEPGIPLVIFFKSEAKDVPVPDGVIYHLWLGIPSSPPVDSPSPQPLSSDIRNPEGRPHRCPLLPRVTHVKQKVIVDGHRYITQEIFGIGEGQTTEGVLSSPSTAEAPPGQPLANDIPSISQEVTGLNITSRYSAEPFREMEPTLVSSTMQFPQQSVTYTNRSQDNENEYARECVICLTNPRTVVLLPCRHMCACLPCAEALEAQSRQCPVCRLEFSTLLFLVTLSSTGE